MAQSRLTSVDDVIIDTAADVALRAKDKVCTAGYRLVSFQVLKAGIRDLSLTSSKRYCCMQAAVGLALLQIGVVAPVYEEV